MRHDDTAVPDAISLELFAKLSTGSASPEEVIRVFLPHHLEICPSCRALHERLQKIKDDSYTLLQLQRAVEGRTFTLQLAAELAKRVRAEGRGA